MRELTTKRHRNFEDGGNVHIVIVLVVGDCIHLSKLIRFILKIGKKKKKNCIICSLYFYKADYKKFFLSHIHINSVKWHYYPHSRVKETSAQTLSNSQTSVLFDTLPPLRRSPSFTMSHRLMPRHSVYISPTHFYCSLYWMLNFLSLKMSLSGISQLFIVQQSNHLP